MTVDVGNLSMLSYQIILIIYHLLHMLYLATNED